MWKQFNTYWSSMISILADISFSKSALCFGQKVSCSFMMGGANSCHTCTSYNRNSRSNDNSTCWKGESCYPLYSIATWGMAWPMKRLIIVQERRIVGKDHVYKIIDEYSRPLVIQMSIIWTLAYMDSNCPCEKFPLAQNKSNASNVNVSICTCAVL